MALVSCDCLQEESIGIIRGRASLHSKEGLARWSKALCYGSHKPYQTKTNWWYYGFQIYGAFTYPFNGFHSFLDEGNSSSLPMSLFPLLLFQ